MGRRWAIALIKKAWLVAWDQWEHQNKVLHEEGRLEALHDLPHVNREILQELSLGPSDLPLWQHFYFNTTYEETMQMTIDF